MTRSAGAAIAAVLALASTPALAQDASTAATPSASSPVPVAPPSTATPPAPPVAQPSVSPSAPTAQTVPSTTQASPRMVMESRPVVQEVPEETEQDPVTNPAGNSPVVSTQADGEGAASTPSEGAGATEPVTRAQIATPAQQPPVDSTSSESGAVDAPVNEAVTAPVAMPVGATEAGDGVASTTLDTDQSGSALAQIAAMLAALGLGAWAVMALRRRKPTQRPNPEPELSASAPPAIEADPLPPAHAAEQPVTAYDRYMAVGPAQADGAGNVAAAGAAVPLPRKAPASFEERDALLRRMVAARPDRANPFVSPKARLRRARLILQSLDRTFDRESAIDLSQYPNNWPELARKDYATAA